MNYVYWSEWIVELAIRKLNIACENLMYFTKPKSTTLITAIFLWLDWCAVHVARCTDFRVFSASLLWTYTDNTFYSFVFHGIFKNLIGFFLLSNRETWNWNAGTLNKNGCCCTNMKFDYILRQCFIKKETRKLFQLVNSTILLLFCCIFICWWLPQWILYFFLFYFNLRI